MKPDRLIVLNGNALLPGDRSWAFQHLQQRALTEDHTWLPVPRSAKVQDSTKAYVSASLSRLLYYTRENRLL